MELKLLLIVGLPRSGTSAVAGIVARLGFTFGDDLIQSPEWNPTGSYTDRALHTALLHARHDSRYLENVRELLAQKSGRCAIKDHALIPIAHLVIPMISEEIRVIHTTRPLKECHASWRSLCPRGGEWFMRQEWLEPSERLCQQFKGLEVPFATLRDREFVGKQIAGFLSIPYSPTCVEHLDFSLSKFS